MMPLNYALAAVLLATPAEPPEPFDPNANAGGATMTRYFRPPAPGETGDSLDALVTTRPAVRGLALHWEILDPREVRYVLTRAEDFPTDLKLLRRRYADLADAPPLYDCMRFPDRALVNDLLAFNRAYRQHLDNRQSLELANAWELHQMLLESDRLYQIWDLVRDTRCDYYYVTVRRQALKKLKEMIGDQAYYSGCLPPHVPVWRFARID
jgi:hypothetical protein